MIARFLTGFWIRRSSESYLDYLRKKGIRIGENTVCLDSRHITVDITRPSLVEIGSNVFLHKNTVLLTHDWCSYVFVNLYNDFLPSHGRVKIGNNVWFGESCTILKGVTIGDNCIIGLGSVVTKDIPSNSVAIGRPAKVICTIEEYYKKRKNEYIAEALEYAKTIQENGKTPTKEDFYDDYPAFVDGSNFDKYSSYPYSRVFTKEQLNIWKQNHKAAFKSFEEFLQEAQKM